MKTDIVCAECRYRGGWYDSDKTSFHPRKHFCGHRDSEQRIIPEIMSQPEWCPLKLKG